MNRTEELNNTREELEQTLSAKRVLESQLDLQATQFNDPGKRILGISDGARGKVDFQLNDQLDELRKSLRRAQDDAENMRSAELTQQAQKAALLDELNSMQTENAKLRDQLRAELRKNTK